MNEIGRIGFAAGAARGASSVGRARRFVAYHGTAAAPFEELRSSARGYFGSGIYLTSSIEAAEMYADGGDGAGDPRVLTFDCRLESPLRVVADYSAAAERYDVDSPAGALLEVLFAERAAELFAKCRVGDGHFGDEIRDAAMLAGHDGLVLVWPDGLEEYLFFHADAMTLQSTRLIEFEVASAGESFAPERPGA